VSFVEPVFFAFLLAVAALCRLAPTARSQNAVLLLASLVFYGWREPWWSLLLILSVTVDWWAARAVQASASRRPLWISVVVNLSLLGTYKYADFIVDAVDRALQALGGPAVSWRPALPLPPGISFFTFQSMAYTIDASRGVVDARRSWIDVGAHVAAFPQLVAGPIERASDLLPQLERRRTPDWTDRVAGMELLLWGAVQKLVVADMVGLWVDAVFADPNAAPVRVWAAVVGFMVQILADFSGYTDLARGSARVLGIHLSANFDRPFLAASPSEFWRRWHQTFSRWMHDYVYIPLGGSRRGAVRMAFAASVSLILAGLWHGAAWNFVAWGGWFAVVWLAWRAGAAGIPEGVKRRARPIGVVLTWIVVAVGMLLFREPDLTRSAAVLAQIPWTGGESDRVVASGVLGVALAGGAILIAGGALFRQRARLSYVGRGLAWAAGVVMIAVFWADSARDFVYFQF